MNWLDIDFLKMHLPPLKPQVSDIRFIDDKLFPHSDKHLDVSVYSPTNHLILTLPSHVRFGLKVGQIYPQIGQCRDFLRSDFRIFWLSDPKCS